jgi:hypothetical protein
MEVSATAAFSGGSFSRSDRFIIKEIVWVGRKTGLATVLKSLLLLPDLQTLYIVQNSEKNTTFRKLDLFPFSGKK